MAAPPAVLGRLVPVADAEEDAVAVQSLESELAAIDKEFEDGEMHAFGRRRREVVATMEELRRSQLEVFGRHVQLEVALKSLEPTGDTEFDPKLFCSQFPKEFEARAAEVSAIAATLKSIGTSIGRVNSMVTR